MAILFINGIHCHIHKKKTNINNDIMIYVEYPLNILFVKLIQVNSSRNLKKKLNKVLKI